MISLRKSLATFALCVLVALSCVEASSIRKRDTKVEDAQLSHDYDASAPSRPFRVRVATYTKEVEALLTPANGFLVGETTPVWRTYTKDGQIVHEKQDVDILKGSLMFYQDSTKNAAVLVRGGERGPEFIGQIGDFNIRPSTDSDAAAGKEKRSVVDDGMTVDSRHMVFRVNDDYTRPPRVEIERIEESISESRTKRDASSTIDVIHPTILSVSSYKMASETFDIAEFHTALVYEMALWNGVDLRFRKLNGPAIHLHMAGFVIATDENATPYFNICASKDNCGELNSVATITNMQKYWFALGTGSDFSLESYDIVVASTTKAFAGWYDNEGHHLQTYLTAGQLKCDASVEKSLPTAAFHDDGAFGGIEAATAGLGAVLGAKIDEINNMECNYNHGFVMGRSLIRLSGVNWSPCSQRQIKAFVKDLTCLKAAKEYTSAGNPLPKLLPGHLASTNLQCQKRGWTAACEVDEETCQSLKCYSNDAYNFFANGGTCQSTGTPAEGTPCGNNKECIGGQCTDMSYLVLLPNDS